MKLTTIIIFSFVWCCGLMPAAHELLPGAKQERVEDEIKMGSEQEVEEKFCASDSMMRQMQGNARRGVAEEVNPAVDPQKMGYEERQYALLMREWAELQLTKERARGDGIGVLYDTKVFDPVSEFLRPTIRSKVVPLEALPKGIVHGGNKVCIAFSNDNRMGIYDLWSEKLTYSQPFRIAIKSIIVEDKNAPYAVLVFIDDSVSVYDIENNEMVSSLMIDEADKRAGLLTCRLSANAAFVVCGFKNKKVVVYDAESGQEMYQLADTFGDIICFSLDGVYGVALTYFAPHFVFWDMITGNTVYFDDDKAKSLFGEEFEALLELMMAMNFTNDEIQTMRRLTFYLGRMVEQQNGNRCFILYDLDYGLRLPVPVPINQERRNYLYIAQNQQEHDDVVRGAMLQPLRVEEAAIRPEGDSIGEAVAEAGEQEASPEEIGDQVNNNEQRYNAITTIIMSGVFAVACGYGVARGVGYGAALFIDFVLDHPEHIVSKYACIVGSKYLALCQKIDSLVGKAKMLAHTMVGKKIKSIKCARKII